MQNVPEAARLETTKTVVSKAPVTSAAAKTYAADVSMGKTPAVERVKAPAVGSMAKTPAVESAPKAAAVDATATTPAGGIRTEGGSG